MKHMPQRPCAQQQESDNIAAIPTGLLHDPLSSSLFRRLNMILILLGLCVLGIFILRTQLPTEPGWRVLPPSSGNVFVQHPLPWIMGECYAHETVIEALQQTAAATRDEGLPVIVFALSPRRSDAPHAGMTAEIGYLARTPNGNLAQTGPALLTYGPMISYDAQGVTNGVVSATLDAPATLRLLYQFAQQTAAPLHSVEVAPFALPLLRAAETAIPPSGRAALFKRIHNNTALSGSMRLIFSLPADAAPSPIAAAASTGPAQ